MSTNLLILLATIPGFCVGFVVGTYLGDRQIRKFIMSISNTESL